MLIGWRWRLDGLRQRISAIIILHAALVYLTFLAFTRTGPVANDHLYVLPAPERMAAIAGAFDRAVPSTYPDLIRALTDERQQVRILPALPAGSDKVEPRVARSFHTALGDRSFRIRTGGEDVRLPPGRPLFSSRPVRVSVALPNGFAVEVTRHTIAPVTRFVRRFWWYGLAIAALDLLVIFWLAAQSRGPVERLLHAVRADTPTHLRRGDAREFVELGAALDDMRAGLKASLDERTRIVAAVAHDFRTYMTRLELRSDFIADEDQRTRALRDLEEMRQLMDDALTFAQPAPCDDAAAATDIAGALAHIVRARHEAGELVSLHLSEGELHAHVTSAAFHRMIDNLLDNAHRYGGGETRIEARSDIGEIIVSVEDRGPGVPADRVTELAEPFFRLETSRARHTAGVGLGLSIVQALVHRFEGSIRIENRAGGGLRVRLHLLAAKPNVVT